MKILILGAGQVGSSAAYHLSREESNEVTVVDRRPEVLRELQDRLDIRTVVGHAAYPDVLERAGARDADIVVALTDSDETNMVACQVAYTQFRTPTKIARIRSAEYMNADRLFTQDAIPIDVRISPEQLVCTYVEQLILYPGSSQVLDFADGRVRLVGVKADRDGLLVGQRIATLKDHIPNTEARIAAIYRQGKAMLPDGDTVIQEDDEVFFIADRKDSATEAGDYTVEVSSATINCNIDSDVITIETFAPPEALFSLSGAQCANNDIQFTDDSNILTEFVVVYDWDFGDGTTSTLADPVHAYTAAGDYTVQLTVSYGGQNCEDTETDVITISEPTPFTITVTGDIPFCEGASADLTVPGSYDTYLWSTGETTADITVTSADTYSVTATNSAGCPSTDQIDISVFDLPLITITPDSVIMQQGDTAQLVATGASTYVWSPGESLSDSTIANPIASPLATTIYTVTGTDSNGCIGEGSALVTIDTEGGELPVTAPKLFSPNGDTIDDEWIIANMENFPQCQLVVFGRSGVNVFEASPYNNDWDGNLNGAPLPEGAYYYVISCPDGRSSTGSVSIIR